MVALRESVCNTKSPVSKAFLLTPNSPTNDPNPSFKVYHIINIILGWLGQLMEVITTGQEYDNGRCRPQARESVITTGCHFFGLCFKT